MRIFHGFDALPRFRHPAATVGSYDGVHSGHRELLRTVTGAARAQGGESVVFTFEPHPRVTLGRACGLRLLTSLEEKAWLLEREGVDNLVVIPFDLSFSRLSADEFIGGMLVGRAGIETLVVGFNHRFGRDKQGSFDYLGSHAFGLRLVEVAECDVDDRKVSSTVVRNLVAGGDMAAAARMLAHPYLIIGEAEAGRIRYGEPLKLLPPPGIYDVRIAPLPPQAEMPAGRSAEGSAFGRGDFETGAGTRPFATDGQPGVKSAFRVPDRGVSAAGMAAGASRTGIPDTAAMPDRAVSAAGMAAGATPACIPDTFAADDRADSVAGPVSATAQPGVEDAIPACSQGDSSAGSEPPTLRAEHADTFPVSGGPASENPQGIAARLEVSAAQELIIRDGCPHGRVVITF